MGKNIKKKKRKENKEIIEKKDIEKKEGKKESLKIYKRSPHKKIFLWELLVKWTEEKI